MKQEVFVVAAIVIVGLIIIWPDLVLQLAGVLAFVAAPLALPASGTGWIMVSMFGLALIALGRLVYTAKKAHQLLRIAHPAAAEQVPVKRWI